MIVEFISKRFQLTYVVTCADVSEKSGAFLFWTVEVQSLDEYDGSRVWPEEPEHELTNTDEKSDHWHRRTSAGMSW